MSNVVIELHENMRDWFDERKSDTGIESDEELVAEALKLWAWAIARVKENHDITAMSREPYTFVPGDKVEVKIIQYRSEIFSKIRKKFVET